MILATAGNRVGRALAPDLRFAAPGDAGPILPPFDAAAVHAWRTPEGVVVAYGYQGDGFCWMHWPRLATFRFSPSDPFITAFPQAGNAPEVVSDIYRRSVLPMALQAFGLEAMHASAVIIPDGVVAFAAKSKTGKSTVAYGLSRWGYTQWSDDAVVVENVGGLPEAVPLTFNVRLRPESVAMFGGVPRSSLVRPVNRIPLAGICLLERLGADAGPVRIRRLTPADAFPAVLTHAHVFNPNDVNRRKLMMDSYLAIVAAVPVYEIGFRATHEHLGRLLDAIARQLESFDFRAGMSREPRVSEEPVPDVEPVLARIRG